MRLATLQVLITSILLSNNNHPIILVHGFLGWGKEEVGDKNYWGGENDIEKYLNDRGYQVYSVSLGPVSSTYDCAIETFYQIKGGQVDYGQEHSEKYKIIRKPEDIKKYLPHREPFLFVDEVIEINEKKEIHARKCVKEDEYFLKGHFPNNPIFPGVIIIEALGQASGILGFTLMNKTPEEGSIYVLAGVDKVRFRKRVRPGDNIDLYSKVISEKRGIWKFDCRAELDDELVCTATILCADRKAK